MNVVFNIIQEKDGLTPKQRFDGMTKVATTFYMVGSDLYIGDHKLTSDVDIQDILNKMGTVPAGEDLVSMIMEAAYDDTALDARVTANENALELLNKTDGTAGSIKKTVDDAIATIIAEAPASFDTLKEISDWISGHADDAAAMNSAIAMNTAAIGNESSEGDPEHGIPAIPATGLHADVESLDDRVTVLENGGSGSTTVAADVVVVDSGDYFSGSNAEAVLQEIGQALTWRIY